MAESASTTVAVFICMTAEPTQIYLQRRFNTGYFDGYYEPPAGKLDVGEFPTQAAIREAREEAGVVVAEQDLELFHTYANLTNDDPWLGIFFRTRRWRGNPSISEPRKCDDAGWFELENLPRVTPQALDAMGRILVSDSIEMSTYHHITTQ